MSVSFCMVAPSRRANISTLADAVEATRRRRDEVGAWTTRSTPSRNFTAARVPRVTRSYYNRRMKTLTVRLPEALVAEIEAESRARRVAKSDVIRERLSRRAGPSGRRRASLAAIADLIGSVDGLPSDLSKRRKRYLRTTGYGQKRSR